MPLDKISKVTFFCDDRRVGLLLRAVAGLIVGTPEVVPVINAEAKNGAIKASGSGDMATMFAAYVRKARKTTVQPADAQEFLRNNGRSSASATYLLRQCRDNGFLRGPFGKGVKSSYKVVSK